MITPNGCSSLARAVSRILLVFVVQCLLSANAVSGLEIIRGTEDDRWFYLSGEIVSGDAARLEVFLKREGPQVVGFHLRSPGGDVLEAIKIGTLISSLRLGTWLPIAFPPQKNAICIDKIVPAPPCICASACFILYVAGFNRLGTFVLLHRPSFDKKYFSSLSPTDAANLYDKLLYSVKEYMKSMNVPEDIVTEMISIPSNEIRLFSVEHLRKSLSGFQASYQEWFAAQCGTFSEAQWNKLEDLRSSRESGTKNLDRAIKILEDKFWDVTSCVGSAWLKARQEAFGNRFTSALPPGRAPIDRFTQPLTPNPIFSPDEFEDVGAPP